MYHVVLVYSRYLRNVPERFFYNDVSGVLKRFLKDATFEL